MAAQRGFKKMENSSDTDGDLHLEDIDDKGKKKHYRVSNKDDDEYDSLCKRPRLTKRDIICIVIGAVILAVLVLIFIILAVALRKSNKETEPWKNVRLPSSLKPQLYTIRLEPNLETFDVQGTVTINVAVLQATSVIILHAKDMDIHRDSVSVRFNSIELSVSRIFTYSDNDFNVIILGDQVESGNTIVITMRFNYTLRDDLVGFYKSSYTNDNGTERYLATTQFEPTDARRAFPCFDEPGLKANFSITLTHPSEYSAVSNMPVKTVSTESGKLVTTFQTSYKMSTYLVAFVVSDFNCSAPEEVNEHIKVRVCASPNVFSSTSYAQNVSSIVIGQYEKFFGVDYPLPKQDLFAIPDFAVGAMENWGLITYRETALLYNKTENPVNSQQRVAVVIAHELAHQWFGNLVTMEWWDGLWLNEGFATYVEYIGTDFAEPSWHMMDQFFVDAVQTAFDADGLNYSHPIIQVVSDPDEINSLFDSISYDKGACLIQMLRSVVGEKNFTNGLKHYLLAHQFSNAVTQDLWESINNVNNLNGITVTSMMDTWTKQMGYPVVTIDTSTGQVTQTRFLQNPLPKGGVMASSPYNYIWTIPFTFVTENNSTGLKIISSKQDTINFGSTGNFIKGNFKQNGFYRVNYDLKNWNAIIKHLMTSPQTRSKVLSAVDRAGLLEDAFALSSAGLLNITVALDLSQFLKTEEDFVPWKAALRWIFNIAGKLSLHPIYGKYKRYISTLLSNIVAKHFFNVTELDHVHILLQTQVLTAGWEFGDQSIIDNSLNMFRKWMSDSSQSVLPNFRLVVYRAAIAYGGEKEWDFLWNWYYNTSNPYEKQICLSALAQSREPWILNRYLQYSLTKVRSQDTLYVIGSVSLNVHGRYLAWNFFRNNWDFLFKRYGSGSFSFSRIIRILTRYFTTEQELKQVDTFFSNHTKVGIASRAVKQAKEVIQGNIQWINTNIGAMKDWLDTQ